MTKPDALKSLYGEGHVNATRTRECVAMPGKREQTIITPPAVIEALHALWPDGIALDPCAPPYNLGDPCRVGDRYWDGLNGSGLEVPWAHATYCNPPYGELKKWMEKSHKEHAEHVMLVPLRTHRVWFRLDNYDAVAFLKPLKFVGFKQAFPAPLVALYKVTRYCELCDYTEALQRFKTAFSPLSTQIKLG